MLRLPENSIIALMLGRHLLPLGLDDSCGQGILPCPDHLPKIVDSLKQQALGVLVCNQ